MTKLKTCVILKYCFVQIDMSKIKLDVLKPWITKRVAELLKMEDDVVVEFVFNQLEEKVMLSRNLNFNPYSNKLTHIPWICLIFSVTLNQRW